jgi:hypothetical protein
VICLLPTYYLLILIQSGFFFVIAEYFCQEKEVFLLAIIKSPPPKHTFMVHGTLGLNSLKLLIKVTYPINADKAPCNLFSSPYVTIQPQKTILISSSQTLKLV